MSEQTMADFDEVMMETGKDDPWEKLQSLMDNGTPVKVTIGGVVNSGVVAYVEGIRGFIPASKLSLSRVEDLNKWLNKEIEVQVITVDKAADKLVLSAKDLLLKAEAKKKQQLMDEMTIGTVTEGVVETLQPYGAFVRLSNGLSGLVHVSQISHTRIKHPSVVLKEGQTVNVKVIAIKDGKLSLSMKALQEPTEEEEENVSYEVPKSESISTNLGSLLKNIKL